MSVFRKRSWRWWLLFAVTACAALAVGGIWSNRSRVRIDEATYDKIVEGMTEAEVEAVIGGPAGDYGTAACGYFAMGNSHVPSHVDLKTWKGSEGIIEVHFSNGKVSDQYFFPAYPPMGWFERVRLALGL